MYLFCDIINRSDAIMLISNYGNDCIIFKYVAMVVHCPLLIRIVMNCELNKLIVND